MDTLEIRDNEAIRANTRRYEVIKQAILDLYIVIGNASLCYEIFRRAVSRDGECSIPTLAATAGGFFKQKANVVYMDARRDELNKIGFDRYVAKHSITPGELMSDTTRYSDVENLTPDQLRQKNLTELENIKLLTTDENLKVQIIKQQTDLMDAKRRAEETVNTEKYITYYLPYPDCTCYKRNKDKLKK